MSSPLDADKLDYIARDSLHAGLSVGLGVIRLISRLEVVTITPDTAPNPELEQRARGHGGRIFEIGISAAGLAAFEQMVVSRVMLFERIQLHHKVRTAEAMAHRLFTLAQEERGGTPFTLHDLFARYSDELMIALVGGLATSECVPSGGERSRILSRSLLDRRLYSRAFAFSPQFLRGSDDLSAHQQEEFLHLIRIPPLKTLAERHELAMKIYATAIELAQKVPGLKGFAEGFSREHVLVDSHRKRSVLQRSALPVQSSDGHVEQSDRHFNPDWWSHAFQRQNYCGYIFCPDRYQPLVGLAARIVFGRDYGLAMNEGADRACKTAGLINADWIKQARDAEICDEACYKLLADLLPRVPVTGLQINFPKEWLRLDPDLTTRFANELGDAFPRGLPAELLDPFARSLEDLALFVQLVESDGRFDAHYAVNKKDDTRVLKESDLQRELRRHFQSRNVDVVDGPSLAGGYVDLQVRNLIFELKVCKNVNDPVKALQEADLQAHRYATASGTEIAFVVLAYSPRNTRAVLPLPERIKAYQLTQVQGQFCIVRIMIPWGRGLPSHAQTSR